MKAQRRNNFAILFACAIMGCGNQSGDVGPSSSVEQGPWYEIGKAEAPGEPWPREILNEGSGPVSTPGSLVFATIHYEGSAELNARLEATRKQGYQVVFPKNDVVVWLGSPPLAPIGDKTILSFGLGDSRFRAGLVGVREGSQLRIVIPSEGGWGELPLNGMNGFDSESPDYGQKIGLGSGPSLVEIHKVCEATLYARDGVFHEVGLKSHGERGFTLKRTWRAQWGKLEGTCHGEPFKRETGPNSIEEAHSRGAQIDRGQ